MNSNLGFDFNVYGSMYHTIAISTTEYSHWYRATTSYYGRKIKVDARIDCYYGLLEHAV